MRKCAALLTMILLTACASPLPPVVTTIDTLCVVTTRYHATDEQVAAMKADKPLWGSLVAWLASFNKERDKRCLQPAKAP